LMPVNPTALSGPDAPLSFYSTPILSPSLSFVSVPNYRDDRMFEAST
jgi:hypothetical protein